MKSLSNFLIPAFGVLSLVIGVCSLTLISSQDAMVFGTIGTCAGGMILVFWHLGFYR